MSSPPSLPAPLLLGERVEARYLAGAPVLVAEAPTLAIVLDPSGHSPAAASLSVRHGARQLARIGDAGDGVGTSFIASGGGAASYLSIRTASGGGSDVERVRLDAAGTVSVPADGHLAVASSANVDGALIVGGTMWAHEYGNLVDDFVSLTITRPPTANALAAAFRALSNFVVTHVGAGGGGGGGGSGGSGYSNGGSSNGGSSNGCGSEHAPSIPMPASAAWWRYIDADASEAVLSGPIATSGIYVTPGGCIVASSFCNLVPDFRVSDPSMPPSADALNAAYLQLSNFVVTQVARASILALDASDFPAPGVATTVQADAWIASVPDGVDRMLFPSSPLHPVQFCASGAAPAVSTIDAFQWVLERGTQPLLALSRTGDVASPGGALLIQP